MHHHRHPAGHVRGLARQFDRLGAVFPHQARPVAKLDADREVGVFADRASAAFGVGIGEVRQLAAARGADDADRRQIDKGAGAGAHLAVDDLAQPGKRRRAGAAGVAQGGHPARPAETIGVARHVMRVDKDMSVDVDEPRRHQPALGADRTARLSSRQRRRYRDNLAAGDADIHHPAQPRGGIQHLAAGQQKIVFHRRPFPPIRSPSSVVAAPRATPSRPGGAKPGA